MARFLKEKKDQDKEKDKEIDKEKSYLSKKTVENSIRRKSVIEYNVELTTLIDKVFPETDYDESELLGR